MPGGAPDGRTEFFSEKRRAYDPWGDAFFNFSDLPLRLVPAVRPVFQAVGYRGSINPTRGLQITNTYLLAFFDMSLKGVAALLLDRASPKYLEVQFLR